MNSTALGAEKKENIIFISDAHEKFYDIVNIGLHFFHKDVRLYAASCSEV